MRVASRRLLLMLLFSIAAFTDPVTPVCRAGDCEDELGLMAAAMLTESNEQRAFEMLSTVVKYANASPAKIEAPSQPRYAFGFNVSVGGANIRLGVFPETLGELKLEPELSSLARSNWFRADQIVSDTRDPGLRIRLRLQLAGAVLVQESNRKNKQPGK